MAQDADGEIRSVASRPPLLVNDAEEKHLLATLKEALTRDTADGDGYRQRCSIVLSELGYLYKRQNRVDLAIVLFELDYQRWRRHEKVAIVGDDKKAVSVHAPQGYPSEANKDTKGERQSFDTTAHYLFVCWAQLQQFPE